MCMNVRRINPRTWNSADEDKQILRMMIPVVVELIVTYIIANINQIVLNKFSDTAVAATTAVSMFVSLMLNVYSIFYVGQSIFLAPCWGRKSYQEGSRFWSVSIMDNMVLGVLIGVIGIFGSSFVMTLLKVPGELRQIAGGYLHVVLGLSIFQGIALTCTTAFRAIGRMKVAMAGNTLINGVCIVLNILILTLVPRQKQCIEQYAFAGVFSQLLGMSYYLWMAHRDPDITLHFFEPGWKKYFHHFSEKLFKMGLPGGMEGIVYLICQTIVMSMIGNLGTTALMAKGYTGNLTNYLAMPSNVVSVVAATAIGMSIGIGDEKKVQRCFFKCIGIALCATVVFDGIALAAGRPFMRLFTQDEALLELCMQVIFVDMVTELFRCVAAVLVVALKAIGNVRTPFTMVIAGSLINIAVSWLFGIGLNMGVVGICIGYGADLLYRSIVGMLVWKRHVATHNYPVLGKSGI